MWALSETDMESLSTIGTLGTVFYSIGGFFLGCTADILIGYGGSSTPLSEIGAFFLYKGSWALGIAAIGCFVGGFLINRRRATIMKTIKKETRQISQ